MLYVTTRNNSNPCTAYRVLNEKRGPDGGYYLPFRHPKFSEEELNSLLEKPFGQCVADVLNLLFHCRLTGWDIDFYCGRNLVQLHPLEHKVLIAEAWHTTENRFDHLVDTITERICETEHPASDWLKIAVRIAVWFGLFGELKRQGIDSADISVVSGDFRYPMSAWYARNWGLPIGTIVCCCNENNAVWELLSQGQMRTDAISIPTMIPEADVSVPFAVERLVYEAEGIAGVSAFVDACRRGIPYVPGDRTLAKLRKGFHAVVVGSQRTYNIIRGVHQTHGYHMTPATALAYAGSRDYRASTGRTQHVVIWAEESPEESGKSR